MSERRPQAAVTAVDDVAARVDAVIRPEIRAHQAYQVAKPDGAVKLDANESPYGLTAEVRAQVAVAVANVALNRYPDGGGDAVKAALRRAVALPDEAEIVLGNGADELLQLLTTVIARPDAVVLAPDPTFVMYRLYAAYANVRYVGVPLAPDFTLDLPAMLAAIAREKPALVWLPSPNNPTGNTFAYRDIERIIEAAPGLVVLDEAYEAFGDADRKSVV